MVYKAAKNISPLGKAPRRPFELPDLDCLIPLLEASEPEDLAVIACAAILFYGMARIGELTVSSPVDPSHPPITPSTVRMFPSIPALRAGPRIELHLPFDKVQRHQGDFITIVPQSGKGPCPYNLLSLHLQTNPPQDQPLFSYQSKGRWVPLTRSRFLSRVNQTLKAADRPPVSGHSFRIGGATHYLLEGIPPETVKVIGRWKSTSFERYWRQVNLIAARAMSGDVAWPSSPGGAPSVQGYGQSEEFEMAFDELASAEGDL
ncbi:BZ3501_MvSof-1269-A2-R1_Chr10-2g02445 [Microbotryum saponariae]|nr:BZ3501_MvSof-1269-A2-R1_Chr10-2g02445 [Microbotryum saponariae]